MKSYTKTFWMVMSLAIFAAFLAGCGSATAPPIDLPAPVVGRISVGTPDASGKSTITGTEGAVPGGSIVLAINARLETSASLIWKISDTLMPRAYAQSLPEICSYLGHWCAIADDAGAFEIIIDALIGDEIVLVIIDESGVEISDRLSVIIPSTDLDIGLCDGTGADGTLADLINIAGVPIAVVEGSGESPNKLVLGPYELPLPGCHAAAVEIAGSASTGAKIAVISSSDRIVWIGTLTSEERFLTAQTRVLDETPLALAHSGDLGSLAIALDSASGFAVARLNLADVSIDKVILLPQPTGFVFTELMLMRTMGPFADGGYLGMVLLKGSDGVNTHYFIHYFETTNFMLASKDGVPLNLTENYGLGDVADAAIAINGLIEPLVVLLVTDRTKEELLVLELLYGDGIPISPGLDMADLDHRIFEGYTLNEIQSAGVSMGRFDVGITETSTTGIPVAYVLCEDTSGPKLMRAGNYASTNGSIVDFAPLAGVSAPTLIAVDTYTQSILVGDNILKDIIDFNTAWLTDEML